MADSELQNLPAGNALSATDRIFVTQSDGGSPPNFSDCQKTIQDVLDLGAAVNPATNGFRAVLGTQYLNLQPQTPSGSDTSAETLTLPAAFATGTRFVSSATSGGLTAGTLYYARYLTSTTIAVYTSLANALADSSRVNITATPSAVLMPSGIEATEINFRAVAGNLVALQDGSGNWEMFSPASIAALAFGTVSSGDIRSLFFYNNGGTVTAEWGSAWSAATHVGECPPDCEMVDGVPLKTGDHTRRLIAVWKANGTTSTIIDVGGILSQVNAKIFGSNWDNQQEIPVVIRDFTASWSSGGSAGTWRIANNNSGNKAAFIHCRPDTPFRSWMKATALTNAAALTMMGVALDATSAPHGLRTGHNVNGSVISLAAQLMGTPSMGLHELNWIEHTPNSGTTTFRGLDSSTNDLSGVDLLLRW